MTATLICPLAYPVVRTCAVVNVIAGGCNAVKNVVKSRFSREQDIYSDEYSYNDSLQTRLREKFVMSL